MGRITLDVELREDLCLPVLRCVLGALRGRYGYFRHYCIALAFGNDAQLRLRFLQFAPDLRYKPVASHREFEQTKLTLISTVNLRRLSGK